MAGMGALFGLPEGEGCPRTTLMGTTRTVWLINLFVIREL